MPANSKKRIALIGLGDIARKAYLPILTAYPGVDPVFCTRDENVLRELADQYRVTETYSDLDSLISSQPEAAMVHTATSSHPEVVSKLLRKGIPVFVDKPLAYTLSETEQLLALAERMGTSLFVGFNRRYAPLVRSLLECGPAMQVSWHKNRVALPDDPRTFLFDDFIHVIDGLRFLSPGPVENLTVFSQREGDLLANVQVRWQSGDCLLTGGMNRISGITEERIEYYTPDNKWVVRALHEGEHYQHGKTTPLTFGNWEPTLAKRGFTEMIDAWIESLDRGFDAALGEDIRRTHALCEEILQEVENRK